MAVTQRLACHVFGRSSVFFCFFHAETQGRREPVLIAFEYFVSRGGSGKAGGFAAGEWTDHRQSFHRSGLLPASRV